MNGAAVFSRADFISHGSLAAVALAMCSMKDRLRVRLDGRAGLYFRTEIQFNGINFGNSSSGVAVSYGPAGLVARFRAHSSRCRTRWCAASRGRTESAPANRREACLPVFLHFTVQISAVI